MHQQETALLGRIVAETAHDLNNVLAVTRDAGGLLKDILSTVPQGALPHQDKLARIADSIDRQTRRGAEAAKALNQFAHLADEPLATINVATLIPLAVALTTRHANQRRTVLSVAKLVQKQFISAPPLLVLLTIVACLRACIDACTKGGLEISTQKLKQGAKICFTLQEMCSEPTPIFSPSITQELKIHFALDKNMAILSIHP